MPAQQRWVRRGSAKNRLFAPLSLVVTDSHVVPGLELVKAGHDDREPTGLFETSYKTV